MTKLLGMKNLSILCVFGSAFILNSCGGLGGKDCPECIDNRLELTSAMIVQVGAYSGLISASTTGARIDLNSEEALAAEEKMRTEDPGAYALYQRQKDLELRFTETAASNDEYKSKIKTVCLERFPDISANFTSDYSGFVKECLSKGSKQVTEDTTKRYEQMKNRCSKYEGLVDSCLKTPASLTPKECFDKYDPIITSDADRRDCLSPFSIVSTASASEASKCLPSASEILVKISKGSSGNFSIINLLLSKLEANPVECAEEFTQKFCFGGKTYDQVMAENVKDKSDLMRVFGCSLYIASIPIAQCPKGFGGADVASLSLEEKFTKFVSEIDKSSYAQAYCGDNPTAAFDGMLSKFRLGFTYACEGYCVDSSKKEINVGKCMGASATGTLMLRADGLGNKNQLGEMCQFVFGEDSASAASAAINKKTISEILGGIFSSK